MDGKLTKHRAEAISGVAERQHGVIATAQLYSLGLSETQVRGRSIAGWLHQIHRGVYAVGHRRLTPEGRWMAAVLAAGNHAVLSHRSAAELWGIRPTNDGGDEGGRIDVAIPFGEGGRSQPRLVVHRLTTLQPDEMTVRHGIPVSSPERTIFDLAPVYSRRALERAVDESARLGLCQHADLEKLVMLHRGRAGVGALRRLLDTHRAGSTITNSELEERFLGLSRKFDLPQPNVNVSLLGYIVDFLWPDASLIVEVDGHPSHITHRAFQADRDRDGRLTLAGYRVVRFTWFDVTRRPAVVADRVRRLLASSAARRVTSPMDG